jgi:hypothetical protein
MPHDNIIDHIFAGSPPLKKQKKRKSNNSQSKPVELKSPAPEIVHDPSSQPRSSTSKRHSSHIARRTVPVLHIYSCDAPRVLMRLQPSKKRKLVDKHDEDNFNDSRGTGPREYYNFPCTGRPQPSLQGVKLKRVSRYSRKPSLVST